MARRAKSGRPKPFAVGEIRGRVIRGPKDGRWYWRAEIHRSRSTVWTGWATRAEAIANVATIRGDGLPVPDKGRARPDEIRTVEDLLDVWLGSQQDRADITERTAKVYADAVDRVRAVIGFVELGAVSVRTIEHLRNGLSQRYAPRTVLLDLQRTATAWNWGTALGLVPPAPFPRVTVRQPRPDKYTPTEAEVARVLAEVAIPWRRVALLLQFATGARVGDIAHLLWTDVDLDGATVHFRTSKARTARRTPIGPDVVAELRRWREQCDPAREELLGVTYNACRVGVQRELVEACERAGVPTFTSHALRRFVVDRMARAGIDPATASRITGHSEITMLRFYRQPTRDDLREAVARARLGSLPGGTVIDFPKTGNEE